MWRCFLTSRHLLKSWCFVKPGLPEGLPFLLSVWAHSWKTQQPITSDASKMAANFHLYLSSFSGRALTDSYYPIYSVERMLNDLEALASRRVNSTFCSHHSAAAVAVTSPRRSYCCQGSDLTFLSWRDQLNKGRTTTGSRTEPCDDSVWR